MYAKSPLENPQNGAQKQRTSMSENPIRDDAAHIYCSVSTRDLVRSHKRGGETYDELLQRMAYRYNPDAERDQEKPDDGV